MYTIKVLSGSCFHMGHLYHKGDTFRCQFDMSLSYPEMLLLLQDDTPPEAPIPVKQKFGIRKDSKTGLYNVISIATGKKYNDVPMDKDKAVSLRETLDNG